MNKNALFLLLGILLLIGTGGALGISMWQQSANAKKWKPVFDEISSRYGLPPDVLARIAYQESHFRDDIITGTSKSPAGAMGIMQMMPAYFSTVRVPTPYSDADVAAQINEAGKYLSTLYQQFGSWNLALAAYNAGPGNVRKYGGVPPFAETQQYVAQILQDLPALV